MKNKMRLIDSLNFFLKKAEYFLKLILRSVKSKSIDLKNYNL